MKQELSIQQNMRIFKTAKALNLPESNYGITPEGVVFPNSPLIAADKIASRPQELNVNKKLQATMCESWSAILRSIHHLTNPYTPFSHLDIPEYQAAVKALTFASRLIGLFERQQTKASIILPPTIQFSPGLTYKQKKSNGEYMFAAQVWDPPTGLNLEDFSFLLTLFNQGKKYQHPVVIRQSMLQF